MEDNGSILNGKFVPRDIIVNILDQVEPLDLLSCRGVCQLWNEIIDNELWKIKFRAGTKYKSFSNMTPCQKRRLKLPWFLNYRIFVHDLFERNLFRNSCGEHGLRYWITRGKFSVHSDGLVTSFPKCDDFVNIKSCFVAEEPKNYHCIKKDISLRKLRFCRLLLDELRPKVTVSFWCALTTKGESECLLITYLKILGHKCERKTKNITVTQNWQKVELEFENYTSGLRDILIKITLPPRQHGHLQYTCITGLMAKLSLSSVSHVNWDKLKDKNYWMSKSTKYSGALKKLERNEPFFPWFTVERLLRKRPFGLCIFQNPVNLNSYGLYSFIMDKLQPTIEIYMCCGLIPWRKREELNWEPVAQFPVSISLLNRDKDVLLKKTILVTITVKNEFEPQVIEWNQYKYDSRVKYVELEYEDQITWADKYGKNFEDNLLIKMAICAENFKLDYPVYDFKLCSVMFL